MTKDLKHLAKLAATGAMDRRAFMSRAAALGGKESNLRYHPPRAAGSSPRITG